MEKREGGQKEDSLDALARVVIVHGGDQLLELIAELQGRVDGSMCNKESQGQHAAGNWWD